MDQPPDGDAAAAFARLVALIARLRAPGGCPWDREQTHRSLRPMTLEEAYEVLEAIDEGDDSHLAGASWATCSCRWSSTRKSRPRRRGSRSRT
jgi:hypothetical protein